MATATADTPTREQVIATIAAQAEAVRSPGTLAAAASGGTWRWTPQARVMDEAVTLAVERRINPDVIVIDMPPQHGKSEYNSHWLPVWYLGRYPNRQVILTSYSGDFSKRWGRKARRTFRTVGPEYFGLRACHDRRQAGNWGVAEHAGGMISSGIGGMITGEGAHLFIVDDPVKNAEEATSQTVRESHWQWLQSTALTRRRPGAVVVVIMTRWHEDDVSGRFLRWGRENPGRLLHLHFPAICEDAENDLVGRKLGEPLCPMLFPLSTLEDRRIELGSYWWNAMYQGHPGAWGASEWPDDYFRGIFVDDGETWPHAFSAAVIALDPSKGKNAKKGDFSALTFAGLSGGFVWVDVDIARRDVSELCAASVRFAAGHPEISHFGLESNAFQDLLAGPLDEATKDAGVPPLPIALMNNSRSKVSRIQSLGPWLARRKIRLRRSKSAELLVMQMKDFPVGLHDDGPDSLEMALRLLRWSTTAES